MKAIDELILVLWLSLILTAFGFPLTMAESPTACNITNPSYPRILDFGFSPRVLIIENASSQITLQIHVTDENNDINSIEAVFLSPSQNQFKTAFMNSTNQFYGVAKNDNYTINMSFSPTSECGLWTLYYLIVCDKPGDCKKLDETRAEMLGFPTKLLLIEGAQSGSLMSLSNSSALREQTKVPTLQTLDTDPNELRGWTNTDNKFSAQRKIIINNVFNRPAGCWP
jgi:hypothetical protein